MLQNVLSQDAKRIDWIDFIKVLATFMVLFQHSISPLWTSASPNTILWKSTHYPFIFSRIAVLLFFMCSGYTMLKKERSISTIITRNIFPILKVYFFWMLIYGIQSCISLYTEGLASARTCINAIIKSILFGHYHTWFIFTLIMLYLITPFLYQIIKNKINTEYFIILSIIFTILIPILHSVDALSRLSNTLSNFNMNFVFGYVLYYILGYYIAQMKWRSKHTLFSLTVFIISLATSCFITMYSSLQTGNATQEIFSEFSPFAFLTTISFFGLIRGMENFSFPPMVSKIASLGFGIYLLHPLFIDYIKQFCDFKIFIIIPLFYAFCLFICSLINRNKLLSFLFLK